jgi:phosphate transport system ATP-binding protein
MPQSEDNMQTETPVRPQEAQASAAADPGKPMPKITIPEGKPEEKEPTTLKLRIRSLAAFYGDKKALHEVDLDVPANKVTAMIGPSGCGKSTLVRCINRMHETIPGAVIKGHIEYMGSDILAPGVDPVLVRQKIGMVFQKATPFPTLSIFDNVAAGLRLNGERDARKIRDYVERSLHQAALWDEVKDLLNRPGGSLSGGQQQRLCIARALAVEPDVLLMDEPCSALDPISTSKIEDLVYEIRSKYTIVIVTHNMQQAARVSQKTVFMLSGKIIEFGDTSQVFTNPSNRLTEEYITGRFG